MTEYVFPRRRAVVAWEGKRIRLVPHQRWSPNDPLVIDRPELFDVDPGATSSEVVERATRAPGETRVTPARRRTKTTKKSEDG